MSKLLLDFVCTQMRPQRGNLPKIVKTGVVMMGCRVLNYACSLVQFVETASFAAKHGFKRINLVTPLIPLPFHSLIARA